MECGRLKARGDDRSQQHLGPQRILGECLAQPEFQIGEIGVTAGAGHPDEARDMQVAANGVGTASAPHDRLVRAHPRATAAPCCKTK